MVKKHNINGSLGDYRIIETLDGSTTLFSEAYQEACHSDQGAYQETLYNYIEGNQVLERFSELKKQNNPSTFTIFEVGFATGLGVKVTIDTIKGANSSHRLLFVSTEIDKDLAYHSMNSLQESGYIELAIEEKMDNLILLRSSFKAINGELIVLIGNARATIKEWLESSYFQAADCVYQDAFSPKRNPELWTKEWFKDLAMASKVNATMTTYSATKAVWKAMMASSWGVKAVKGFGNKKLSTRAFLGEKSSQDVLEWCKRSPTPALSDGSLL